MNKTRLAFVLTLAAFASVLLSSVSLADTRTSWCRRSDGTEYPVYKAYSPYEDTSQSTCYGGQNWCTKTVHGSVKLRHWHFTQNFTAQEREDADRWVEYTYGPPDSSNRLMSATTTFNCHSYALGPNASVWNVDQVVTLQYDYDPVAGTPADPFQVGQICQHVNNHSSIITALQSQTGFPWIAVTEVKSKWAEYGKYQTTAAIYGGPVLVWKPK